MKLLTLLLTVIPLMALGVGDTPTRFSGLGTISGPLSWSDVCGTVAFRSEDLSDPAFVNRLHILVQIPRGCPDIPDEVIEGPIMIAALPDGRMQIVVYEWNLLLLPTDPAIRQFMIAGSQAPNGGFEIRRQKLTVSKAGENLFEFLIEEPRV